MSNAPNDAIATTTSQSPLPEPRTERAQELRAEMSPERWRHEVETALRRVDIVKLVERMKAKGHGARAVALRRVSPGTHWSTYCHWRRCLGTRQGPDWERLLDRRVPPRAKPVDADIRAAAVAYRYANRKISCQETRFLLTEQFGGRGSISDSTLGRIWRNHGVSNPAAGDPGRFERVETYSGGGLVPLLLAAASESGAPETLARAAQAVGEGRLAEQGDAVVPSSDPVPGRDANGRFTPAYNRAMREGVTEGQRDARWDSDAAKRGRRDLSGLSILSLAPETLGQRLLTMGMVSLVTGQRGFDGMDAPRAHWLGLLGWTAYRPFTLDKTLAELGVLDADEAVWEAHAQVWAPKAKDWAAGGPPWLQIVRYLDLTSDPHWTPSFAKSGKVSRTGRVQPCLQRATLTAGPGVSLRMETVAGTHDLKKVLRALLEEDFAAVESGAAKESPEWITVVDAEAAVPALLAELVALPRHRFVTVMKGSPLKGATIVEKGDWAPYRRKDQLCEVEVTLACGLVLRGVWMQRLGTRHIHRTLYVTDASKEVLSTSEVADIYLSRWPNQEFKFRDGRHGAGLEHSRGFTGELVTHVALERKQEKAKKRAERLEAELQKANGHELDTQVLTVAVEEPLYQDVAAEAAHQASARRKKLEKQQQKALAQQRHQATMPREIFQRDTTRENIATACVMSVLMLVEWVLREYMGGGVRLELQSFINYFLYLPVEVRTSWHRRRYRIDITNLPATHAEMLSKACDEINRRKIRRDDRLLQFELFRRLDQTQ